MIIVVARYNEDIEWTKHFPNVIIYNKGTKLKEGYNEIVLDNVGREGHTYYKYICDNYDHLEDYTIFLQGFPLDHSPNIINDVNKYINNKELNIDFEYLSQYIHYTNFELHCQSFVEIKDIYSTFEKIFGIKCAINHELVFGAGAQFIVSRNTILKKPKEFYENIVKILEYSINPIEGYHIERLHKYIFM